MIVLSNMDYLDAGELVYPYDHMEPVLDCHDYKCGVCRWNMQVFLVPKVAAKRTPTYVSEPPHYISASIMMLFYVDIGSLIA